MDGRLDRAKIKYGGRFLDSDVDDVKVLSSLLPTLLFLVIYCSCYYQVCLILFESHTLDSYRVYWVWRGEAGGG